jgi:zinc/manganese transport system permease protein
LGLGVLFLSLYSGYANATYSILFGQVLGVSTSDIRTVALVSGLVLVSVVVVFRPLLFSSVDSQSAASRGISNQLMSVLFMTLLALTTVVAVQVVGVLLVFSLLVAPAAAAEALTSHPLRAVALSVGLALFSGWMGLFLAVWLGGPVSFWITALASLAYVMARLSDSLKSQRLHSARV